MKKVILLIALLSSGFFVEMKMNEKQDSNVKAIELEAVDSSKDSLASSIAMDSISK